MAGVLTTKAVQQMKALLRHVRLTQAEVVVVVAGLISYPEHRFHIFPSYRMLPGPNSCLNFKVSSSLPNLPVSLPQYALCSCQTTISVLARMRRSSQNE